jgi:hypothetical protein
LQPGGHSHIVGVTSSFAVVDSGLAVSFVTGPPSFADEGWVLRLYCAFP